MELQSCMCGNTEPWPVTLPVTPGKACTKCYALLTDDQLQAGQSTTPDFNLAHKIPHRSVIEWLPEDEPALATNVKAATVRFDDNELVHVGSRFSRYEQVPRERIVGVYLRPANAVDHPDAEGGTYTAFPPEPPLDELIGEANVGPVPYKSFVTEPPRVAGRVNPISPWRQQFLPTAPPLDGKGARLRQTLLRHVLARFMDLSVTCTAGLGSYKEHHRVEFGHWAIHTDAIGDWICAACGHHADEPGEPDAVAVWCISPTPGMFEASFVTGRPEPF